MNIAIVLAGGVGSRVGAGKPKQFIEVLGKPILAYTVDIFQKNERMDAVVIVCHRDWIDYCWTMVRQYGLTKVRWICEGGENFDASIQCGVRLLEGLIPSDEVRESDQVFIQYGGAPFTSQKIVNAVIDMTEERGSAVTGTPCYQLLSTRDTDSTSLHWLDRDKHILLACPYGFRFSYLLGVYRRAREQDLLRKLEPHLTTIIYALGDPINYAYGDQTNIKITTAEDIELFEGYVMVRQKKGTC